MILSCSYSECAQDYGPEVAEILHRLQSSGSKHKHASDASQIDWNYEWAVNVTGSQKTNVFFLTGKIGRWRSSIPIDKEPDIVRKYREKAEATDQKEQDRLAQLSPEERAKETQDLLRGLQGNPGFYVFGSQ